MACAGLFAPLQRTATLGQAWLQHGVIGACRATGGLAGCFAMPRNIFFS